MKLTSILALLFALAASGTVLAYIFLHLPIDKIGAGLTGGFIVATLLCAYPKQANAWVMAIIDHLPSWGKPKE